MYSLKIEAKTRKKELLFIFQFLFMTLAYIVPTKEKKVSQFSIIILIILNFENFFILFVYRKIFNFTPRGDTFIMIFYMVD